MCRAASKSLANARAAATNSMQVSDQKADSTLKGELPRVVSFSDAFTERTKPLETSATPVPPATAPELVTGRDMAHGITNDADVAQVTSPHAKGRIVDAIKDDVMQAPGLLGEQAGSEHMLVDDGEEWDKQDAEHLDAPAWAEQQRAPIGESLNENLIEPTDEDDYHATLQQVRAQA